jgi:dihydrolipoamide dehydrogenase
LDQNYEVIVIGAGPGGEVCAAQLGKAGKRVAIIERERVGGECAFWACVPSKVLLRSQQPSFESRQVPGSKAALGGEASFAEAAAWRTETVGNYDDSGQVPFLRDSNVTLIRGQAQIEEPGVVRVGEQVLKTEATVIATGSQPAIPPIDGLQGDRYWTSREATAAGQAPKRLLILGGGAVGVELAQVFARYGTKVTVIEPAPQLLAKEEPGVAKLLAAALEKDGVSLKLAKSVQKIEWGNTCVMATLGGGEQIETDEMLVATGRSPRTAGLNAQALGLKLNKNAIAVDKQCRAGDRVYAIGDVTGVAMFTHVAKYQGRIAADSILGKAAEAQYEAVPRCIFTDPEVGAVGKTQAELREANVDYALAEVELTSAARGSLYYDNPVSGSVGLIADKTQRTLLGAYIVGPMASEMIGAASVAIRNKIPVPALLDVMQPFPTFSEAFFNALQALKL